MYIRDVTGRASRAEEIRKLAAEVARAGSRLVLADDAFSIAEHAAEHGWISPEHLASVMEDRLDEQAVEAG